MDADLEDVDDVYYNYKDNDNDNGDDDDDDDEACSDFTGSRYCTVVRRGFV